VLKLQACL